MANTFTFTTVTGGSTKYKVNSGPSHIIEENDWLDQLGGSKIRITSHNGGPDIDVSVDTVITVVGGVTTTYGPGSNVDTVYDALNPLFKKGNSSSAGSATTDAAALTSGTLNDARLSSNVTKQGNTYVNAALNGVTTASGNVSPALQALIGSNKTIFLPRGTYTIGAVTEIESVSNLRITGEKGTKITYAGGTGYGKYTIFSLHGTLTNVEIDNIEFEVTATDAVENNSMIVYNGALSGGLTANRIKIHDCFFTAPNANINAFGALMYGTQYIKDCQIYDNTIDGIGRMGGEFVSRDAGGISDAVIRMTDFRFENNIIRSTGLKGSWGCGISISGAIESIKVIENKFYNLAQNHAIEIAGGNGFVITGNTMKGTTSFNGISISNPENLPATNVAFAYNTIDISGANAWGFFFDNVSQFSITGNTINTGDYSRLVDCSKGNLTGNTVKSNTYWALKLMQEEVGTTNVIGTGNTFDNSSTSTANYGTVLFDGAGTTNNRLTNNNIITKGSGFAYAQTGGATGNTFWSASATDLKADLHKSQIQNLALQSENLSNSTWNNNTSGATITNLNGANDISANPVLNTVTITDVNNIIRQNVTVLANTDYTFSFEARRGTATAAVLAVLDATHGYAEIVGETSYYSLTSSTQTVRVSIRFTTPVGCTTVAICPLKNSPSTGTIFIGKILLNETASVGTYVKTTTAAVLELPAVSTSAPTGTMKRLLVSNVKIDNTGSTTLNTVYTGTIPANSIGVNGAFHIAILASAAASNANVKTIYIHFNGVSVGSTTLTSTLTSERYFFISNRNSLTSQVAQGIGSGSSGTFGNVAIAPATFSFDTSADITVTIKIQNAVGTDTTSLEAFQLWTVD